MLARFSAENFRCLNEVRIEPHARLNLFLGPNAAGKTSLLEALHTLGRGRSFRGNGQGELSGQLGAHWRVLGRLEAADAPPQTLGLAWDGGELSIRVNRENGSRAELVQRWPVQVIDPAQHRLLEDGPAYRRRFLDWGVFHVEHSFIESWRRYQLALRQRNRALKTGANPALVSAWDAELVESGEAIHAMRQAYLEKLRPAVLARIARLLQGGGWSLELQAGWNTEYDLAQALSRHLDRDRRLGQTVDGPHRAELRLRVQGQNVRNHVSRGQQKMLVAALVLAQALQVAAVTGTTPALLLDDLPAELGPEYQQRLVAVLNEYPGQIFVTALEPIPAFAGLGPHRMFHVEQGRVQAARAD